METGKGILRRLAGGDKKKSADPLQAAAKAYVELERQRDRERDELDT
jgi:hypothetical protein